MTRILAVIAFSASAALAGSAQAQGFPNWPSSLTCQSGDSSCVRFETFARGQISGTWNTLPSGARVICLAETQKVEKSYRLLQNCLANVMQELLANQNRKPPSGDVVNLTPKAKVKALLPVPQAGPEKLAMPAKPEPAAEPAAQAAPMAAPTPTPMAAPMVLPDGPVAPPATSQ